MSTIGGTGTTTTGATIGQAATLNSAAYDTLSNGTVIDGYQVVNQVPINSNGFGYTEFVNQSNGSIYVAIEGTVPSNVNTLLADLSIVLGQDPAADNDALNAVSTIVDDNPGALVQIGGHSLGGRKQRM